MRAKIKELKYWKTEHKEEGCQDAYRFDSEKGLFVVADGAGTTLFPAIWANILAEHFIKIPLILTNPDPFEIEWWVRLAQREYEKAIPSRENLGDWSIRVKAQNQGSDSTLATLRFSALDTALAQAELLVFGDSCVIIGNTKIKKVESFVLENPADFAQAPICIPSSLKFFNRYFHTCSLKSVILEANYQVILASDAVSKWILSGGGGRYTGEMKIWEAFQKIYNLSVEDWPGFIEESRDAKEMVNDDSTALILTLLEDSTEEGVPLGATPKHTPAIIQERKEAFDNALQEKNSELLAVYYGNGADLKPLFPDITEQDVKHFQEVADAMKEVLRNFRQVQNTPGLVAKMQQVWGQYGSILQDEKCAENIRETLRRNGVNLNPAAPMLPQGQLAVPGAGSPSQTQPVGTGKDHVPDAKTKLENTFLKAKETYGAMDDDDRKNNYQPFLEATEALEVAYQPGHFHFSSIQEKLIEQARSYKRATEKLQKALSEGDIYKIDEAYQPQLISAKRFAADAQTRILLACKLVAARKDNDDKVLLEVLDEMERRRLQGFFKFTSQDQEYITRVQRYRAELKAFQDDLATSVSLERVAKHSALLEGGRGLTDNELRILFLAIDFVKVYKADDDLAIIAIYDEIMQSTYRNRIAFTIEGTERITQAKEYIKKMKIVVAKVKSRDIFLEEVKQVSTVQKVIYLYWIDKYQKEINKSTDEEDKQHRERQIADWKGYMDPSKIAGYALEDLLNDLFIREKLSEPDIQRAFESDPKILQALKDSIEHFQHYVVRDYNAFLNENKLNHQVVETILGIESRHEFLKSYFENQQKAVQPNFIIKPFRKAQDMKTWLANQKKDVVYLYGSDLEQRAKELAMLLGWQK